jgi:hypothetical protein
MRIKGKEMNHLLSKCKWVVALLLVSGCVHQMELSRQTMKKIDGLATGKSFWLKQSLYAGPFYDDDRFTLLHASSFDELTYLKMPDGATILPPKPSFIIPVGTRVTITAIEWPDWNNFVKRPIFTPRHLPWMKMTVAMQRGQVSLMRPETFIFLLPVESDNSRHFESWFLSIFSDKDTNPWLLGLKPEVQNAVLGKRAMAGMSREALRAALGDPGSWSNETSDEGAATTKEIAHYAKQVVVLEDGVVTKVQALTPSTPAQFQSADRMRED